MASSEHPKRLRAELAAELGYSPAPLDPEDIQRHRRLNAALDAAPSRERVARDGGEAAAGGFPLE